MNFTSGRNFVRLKKWINITLLGNQEKMGNLIPGTVSIQARTRTKLVESNLFEMGRNKKDSRYEKDERIGLSGYFLLGIPIGTFLLGTWQVQRRKWKLSLIEDLNNRISEEPIELPQNLEELESKEYRKVKVRGSFLHEKEFVIGPRSLIVDGKAASEQSSLFSSRSQKGYCVVTPFKIADRDLTILVNRGWVPANYKNPATREVGQIEGVIDLIGVVRLNETRPPFTPKNDPKNDAWFFRDINEMAELAGTAPVYIEMVSNNNIPGAPLAGQTRVSLRNEHMSYIITWYSLSALTAYMWYKAIFQKLSFR